MPDIPHRVGIAALCAALIATTAMAAEPDYANIFEGRDGCFELYDLQANKLVVRSNHEKEATRTRPGDGPHGVVDHQGSLLNRPSPVT